ncbi:alpha/beta hydrolase [Candidatus Latescibacterota bacterium]
MKMPEAIRNIVFLFISIGLIGLLLIPFSIIASDGKLITESVHSLALEGNLLGDSPDRNVLIYLPPDYEENTVKKYPAIYLLHGYTCDHTAWLGDCYIPMDKPFISICNNLIEQGAIQPMIIVMPDAKNKYLGSWYTNSSVTGNWEDFITQDLVAYVDSNYRTIPQVASRGIAGHSMGGYGAIKLAMKHPDIYSAAYSLSGVLDFDDFYLNRCRKSILSAVNAESIPEDGSLGLPISSAVAYAPNPENQPFQSYFPLDKNDNIVESVWEKWLQHDPLTMITSYKENLLQLSGIQFDCGTSDGWCFTGNQIFSQALTDANIPHIFEEYEGDHTSEIPNRIEKHLLPFFSEVLAFQSE